MDEKTIRDMLPLSDEALEGSNNENNEERCSWCLLASRKNGTEKLCVSFVFGKERKEWTCSDVRAEALRLDSKHRAKHNSKILTRDELKELLDKHIFGFEKRAHKQRLGYKSMGVTQYAVKAGI